MKHPSWFAAAILLWSLPGIGTALPDELSLMQSPVRVTATVNPVDEGGFSAQFAIHNGPLAQVVGTTMTGVPLQQAEDALRHQLTWRAPYLLVHSSCNINSVRRCEGNVIFKVAGSKVTRLGDFVDTDTAVLNKGRFYDSYDKLGEQIEFTVVLRDINDDLQVDDEATWAHNVDSWTTRANYITNATAAGGSTDTERERYFSSILNNAALARYCNHTDALEQLLSSVNLRLDLDHRRQLADTLSKVLPLEKPKLWRKAF